MKKCPKSDYDWYWQLARKDPYYLSMDDYMFLSAHKNCCGQARITSEALMESIVAGCGSGHV